MGVSALIACLAVAGLEMSRVAGRVNQQMRDQIEARRMAQAGLEYWQRQYNSQALKDPTNPQNVSFDSRSGFTVSATMSPLGVSPTGAAQVTSVGTYGSAIQRLTARYEARPTLYEGFRCALYSNDASITHSSSSVDANHWSIARQDTSSSSSNIFMDAMTGNSFTGTPENFRQRRVSSIPWNMETGSFDPSNIEYPGAAYTNSTTAITIQPPVGKEQLLVNPNLDSELFPWYSNSSATLIHDTTRVYNNPGSGRMIGRTSGTHSPVQEISRFLVRWNQYVISAWVRPENQAASFQWRITFFFENPTATHIYSSTAVNINANTWGQLSWTWDFQDLPDALDRQPTKVELGIISNNTCNFNFDTVSMTNNSQNGNAVHIQNTLLSDKFNPFSVNNSVRSSTGIYIVDCRGREVRIENCRIRSTLVFTNCPQVVLSKGIVWEVPNKHYPAIIANAPIVDETTFDTWNWNCLRESDIRVNLNPSHTPFKGQSNTDNADIFFCSLGGPIFSTSTISLGNNNKNRGKIRWLTGPILAKNTLSVQNTTKSIVFDSNMILNPPPGFYPAFTPMRLIPSSIDEASPSSTDSTTTAQTAN
jgi:hypothetical protein